MRSSVWKSFLKTLSSYNSNVLLAAVVCLLIVVLFIFLLHFYARFFWSDELRRRRRRRRRIIRSVPMVSAGTSFNIISASSELDKGLDASAISSIPLFVYEEREEREEAWCAICLGRWEVGEVGRRLRKCGHAFHVECIDMWLSSHSTCPLCRAPPLLPSPLSQQDNDDHANGVLPDDNGDPRLSCCLPRRSPLLETEDDQKPDGNGVDGVGGGGEEEVIRVVVVSGEDEDDDGGDQRSSTSCFGDGSSSSSSSSSLKSRSRSERNKVFPSIGDE